MSTEPAAHATGSTRLFAALVLATVVTGLALVGNEIYRAVTDSFVAPIILTPDNDAVIASKLSLSQLQAERAKVAAEMTGIDEDLAASDQAAGRLESLRAAVTTSLAWTEGLQRRLAKKGAVDVEALDRQATILQTMLTDQERITAAAERNLKAGLVSTDDHQREVLALNQLRVTLLENRRSHAEHSAELDLARLAQDSLSRKQSAPAMPERIVREDQLVRIELELLRLGAEQRARKASRRLDVEKLAKVDELERQLKARPIFRAIEQSVDLAFVPYTQIDGVAPGAAVLECVWGLFHCRSAGTVREVVPGEVILPDPWGNQARGQYAILRLEDREAARARTLRVRKGW